MNIEEHIKSFLIERMGLDGMNPEAEGTIFVLRYDSQDPEDRQQFEWNGLINELAEQSAMHGLEDVLEAVHIEMQKPAP
ncbi:MAG: hypothetical protein HGB04_05135 [Chlorobiaceae bacterium]|nr:hypothetical protein [Chlorobiaceae bacterium]